MEKKSKHGGKRDRTGPKPSKDSRTVTWCLRVTSKLRKKLKKKTPAEIHDYLEKWFD